MERKLVKQGRNALTLTLPAGWLKEHGLEAGDVVNVEETNQQLLVGTTTKTIIKTIELDVRGDERHLIFHRVLGAYLEGYDTLFILHDDPALIQEFSKGLIGMITEEQTAQRTILQSIIAVPKDDFDKLFMRTIHQFNQHAKQLIEVAEKKLSYQHYKIRERELDNTIYYCWRYLSKYHHIKHAYQYFLLLETLEAAADQLGNIAKHKLTKPLAEQLVKGTENYTTYLLKHDFKKLYTTLRSFRNALPRNTFTAGLAYAYAETLYNNMGYLLTRKEA